MEIINKNHIFSSLLSLLIYIGLPLLCVFFLWLHQTTHIEFLLHLAAIPLEILIGAFLVERFLSHEAKKQDLRKHMYIKSYIFRSELRNVFIANVNALKYPPLTISEIRTASIKKLQSMRDKLDDIQYGSDEEIENVIIEYTHAHKTFYKFMEWAVDHDFETIFFDMIHLLHFIQDVTQFKKHNPGKLFITEAKKDPKQIERVNTVLKNGIFSLLDYVIQLKEENPVLIDEIIEGYEQTNRFSELTEVPVVANQNI